MNVHAVLDMRWESQPVSLYPQKVTVTQIMTIIELPAVPPKLLGSALCNTIYISIYPSVHKQNSWYEPFWSDSCHNNLPKVKMHLSVNLRSSAQPNNLQLRVQDPHRSSEVGPLVRHTFTLSNMGPFDVGHLAVSLKIEKYYIWKGYFCMYVYLNWNNGHFKNAQTCL